MKSQNNERSKKPKDQRFRKHKDKVKVRKLVTPPPPRYDEIYYDGVNWLDKHG